MSERNENGARLADLGVLPGNELDRGNHDLEVLADAVERPGADGEGVAPQAVAGPPWAPG